MHVLVFVIIELKNALRNIEKGVTEFITLTLTKARICGRSLPEIVGSNSQRGHECLSAVSVMCCQVEVSATS